MTLAWYNCLQVPGDPGPRVDDLDLLTPDAEDIAEAPGASPHYPELLATLPDPDLVVHGADVARGRPLDHPDTGPDVTDKACSSRVMLGVIDIFFCTSLVTSF